MDLGTGPVRPPTAPAPAWLPRAALAALVAALAGFLVWQYLMPRAFQSSFLLDHAGIDQFRDLLGLSHEGLAFGPYRAGFRALLVASWGAYFLFVTAGAFGGALPSRRAAIALVASIALVAAVAWPPSFSCDVYGYIAYGRLQALYGLNPYLTSQRALKALGDPTGAFLVWNIGSPYGPLWTGLSSAVVWLSRGAPLVVQIVAMKLVGGAAVVATALLGGRVAERLAPGRGVLTLLAIGCNPLFVIEGAGNAHNDFVMMAFVVAALDATLAGRARRALLLAGLGGAVKFLPFALVPWIALRDLGARPRPRAWPALARDLAGHALTAALPVVIAFLPYWAGPSTLHGLEVRWTSSQTTAANARVALGIEAATLLAAYVGATAWALRGEPARLRAAWMAVAAVVFLVAAGLWLPWYLAWIWIVALTSWDRRSAVVSHLVFCLAVALTLRYSVPSGG
ncbi:MAG TPA: hypothetical protein VHL80_21265 [Polyangia bacterium]|nr:hypothetical protein [Polyangia bacterium]